MGVESLKLFIQFIWGIAHLEGGPCRLKNQGDEGGTVVNPWSFPAKDIQGGLQLGSSNVRHIGYGRQRNLIRQEKHFSGGTKSEGLLLFGYCGSISAQINNVLPNLDIAVGKPGFKQTIPEPYPCWSLRIWSIEINNQKYIPGLSRVRGYPYRGIIRECAFSVSGRGIVPDTI